MLFRSGDTNRISITIAAGKKAIVETASITVRRTSAAAPVGLVWDYLSVNDGTNNVLFMSGFLNNNTVDTFDRALLPAQFTLYAGHILQGNTSDASTGGAAWHHLVIKGTIFDA